MGSPKNSSLHPRATLAATILGSSLAFIDGSVVNVALPALGTDLHASAPHLPWAINAYLLPVGALTLLGGGLGDHFGRRRLFLQGLLVFLVGSALCGIARSFAVVLTGRALQGVGAALLMPNSLAILGTEFSGEARGRAVGTWAAVGALAGAAGPIVGGWLVDAVGWRTIFAINLPLGAAAGGLAWACVAERRDQAARRLDAAGALLATLALALLTWSLTEASVSGRGAALPCAAAALGGCLMILFLLRERRLGDDALMPLALFSTRAFVGLTLLTFFLYASLGGLLVLLPFFLIQIEGWSAVAAGAALLPVPALIGVASRPMGRLAARHGVRMPLAVGSTSVALGMALFVRAGTGVDYWRDVLPPTLLIAIGMGACVAPLTTGVMVSVAGDRVGIASGLNSAVARVAGLIATALLGFLFVRQDSAQHFIAGFHAAALIGAACAAAAAACAWTLLPKP